MLSTVAVNSLGDMVSPCCTLLLCWSYCFLCVGGPSLSYWCIGCPLGVHCTHLLSPVLEARSVLVELALSQRLSCSWQMRCKVGYYILCTSPSVGVRRGCGLSLSTSICFWIQLTGTLVAGFCWVSSLIFSLVLSWVLYIFLENYHHLPCCGYLFFR